MVARVMVVDDEPQVVRLLEVILTRAGFAVSKARSGQECLAIIERENPDVIVLDVMMPDLSGLEVMRALRATYSAKTMPPVIFLSAKGGLEAMVEGMQAGAYKYLVKPTSRERLIEVINTALAECSLHHQRAADTDWR